MIIIIFSELFFLTLFSIYELGGGLVPNIVLIYFLFIVQITSLYYGYTQVKLKPLFFLMVGMFILFIYSRFMLEAFNLMPYKISWASRFVQYHFSNKTLNETLFVYLYASVSFLLGFYSANKLNKHNLFDQTNATVLRGFLNICHKVGVVLITLSLPGMGLKLITTIKHVLTYGYHGFYTGLEQSSLERLIEFISYKLFILGLSFYLVAPLTNKKFLKISLLMILVSAVYLFLGKRAEFGITIMFILWYWLSYQRHSLTQGTFKLKRKTKIILILLIPGLILSMQYVGKIRGGQVSNNLHVVSSVVEQGVSGIILPYYIDYIKELPSHSAPYIFAPIIDRMERGGQSFETIKSTNYLSHHLTYTLDKKAYLSGEGLGTSFIVELYSISVLLVIIGMFILGYFISIYENHKHRPSFKFASYMVMTTLFFLPRGAVFEYFYEIIFFLCVFIFIKNLYRSAKTKHKLHL